MKYGLIGETLKHSYSKDIHRVIGDYQYELREIPREDVEEFFRRRDFAGINVTIPYKETVMPYLDNIDPLAKAIGAVNTVVNREGTLYGYNTDCLGMEAQLAHMGVSLKGKKVLILGTGGTSKTAKVVAQHLGAREIVTLSRTGKDGAVTYDEGKRLHGDGEFLFNTTPVGMYPGTNACPVNLDDYPCLTGLMDVVYHPLRTLLVQEGAKRGIPAEGGLYMLAAQGVYASALFFGKFAREEDIDRVYRDVRDKRQNIVLIGMPSAGKTAVGLTLQKKTGKPFYDTDKVLEEELTVSCSRYIATQGEAAFREKEAEVVARLSEETGCILATGGGVILREDNRGELQKNGFLVFLDRPLEELTATADRPLSNDKEKLTHLYEDRYPLYCLSADGRVPVRGGVDETAEDVLRVVNSGQR